MGTNLYFAQKYEDGLSIMKIVNIGKIVSGAIFTFLVNIIINPDNMKATITYKNEIFFTDEISSRFYFFMLIFGALCSSVVFLGASQIKNPVKL